MKDAGPHLSLWKQRLGSVPDSVWDRTDLETLVLADNEPSLSRLGYLNISENAFEQLPEAVTGMSG